MKVKQIENFEEALKGEVEDKIDDIIEEEKRKELEKKKAETCLIF